jgi:DNA polymerase-3 subunit gamma/tau
LFSGTRGVGKTTLGRIIAKCLNCERGVTSQPCTEEPCAACAEIDAGCFVDLIEVDAASRTGVDDTRELMENVQYVPTRGRYKVYLIDEVHMLSKHAFNALLKTLEEPPPHVQFLLATTDPQKIPVTILSRCLQFPLKRLPVAEIEGQLSRILEAEGIEAEAAAVHALARAADGSMRDGLSLLDQAAAFGGGALRTAEVYDMLGTVRDTVLRDVVTAIVDADGDALMTALECLDEQAPDYAEVLDALAAAWHRLALLQVVPDAAPEEAAALRPLAERAAPEDVQLYYDIAVAGRRDLDWAPDPKSGLEMACLRMLAFRPAGRDAAKPATPAPVRKKEPAPPSEVREEPAAERTVVSRVNDDASTDDWHALVERLPLKAMAAQLARNCVCREIGGGRVLLELPASLEHLLTDNARKQMESALAAELGDERRIEIRLGDGKGDSPARRDEAAADARRRAAREAIESDPNVRELQERLGARIREDSIEPEGE